MEKITKQPFVLSGQVMHHRLWPKKNHFNYKSTYISVPIGKISKLKKLFFSLDKFNLFAFYNKDYGHNFCIKDWIYDLLKKNNINNIAEIILITHPRIMGYVFNPVSFWLCIDNKKQLISVVSEVTNTCGQKHNYLCFHDDLRAIKADDWLETQKVFYVSPFMKIEGKYKFRFSYEADNLEFCINYIVDDKLKLSTSLKCVLKEFSNKNLLLSFFAIPFATLKTIILIHYQAIKLYFKKIKYYKYPKPLNNNLTIGKSAK